MKSYFTYGAKASDRDLITSTVDYGGTLKRYFSSLDAELFIGEERIVDIVRIDFNYEEKKMPIYGFNSFIPSRMIVGQKLIQGTFIINFTETGYIANLLEKIDESSIANEYDKVGESCDPTNAALFKKSFDITIGYGGYNISEEVSYNSTYQILQGVYINGYQQILDTSGEPIYEVYTFVARNLEFKKLGNSDTKQESDNQESKENGQTAEAAQGKAINIYGLESIEIIDSNESDISNYNNNNLISSITHIDKTNSESEILVKFPQLINKTLSIDIAKVKITISDNQINMSKTFTLNKTGND